MKAIIESAFVRELIAALIVGYLKFCYATIRWTRINEAAVAKLWSEMGPVVLMFWHERLHLGHACWPRSGAQPVCVLASQSKTGEISVNINKRFGYHSIRGSSAKKSDPNANKGGAQAFRELLRWMRAGRCVAMTPDGPRGPRRVMTEGTLKLSQMTGAPLVIVGESTSHYFELKTWDRMRLPLPLGRGVIQWEVMEPVPVDLTPEALAAMCIAVGARLSAVTDAADAALGQTQ